MEMAMTQGDSKYRKFIVLVTIENKQFVDDPEGETIHRDLIVKGGYSNVKSVRSSKTLKIIVTAKSEKTAEKVVNNICRDLRIFNPVISDCIVRSIGKVE
jgi:phosphoribosylformylglycinamidine synthase subunit PurS